MQNIYVITANYGEWDDYTEVEMYVATDEVAARNRMQTLADEFSAAYAHMVEGLCHGIGVYDSITTFQGDEHVADVARCTYWNEGVSLVLSVMPVGKTFRRAERLDGVDLSFYPEGWDEDRIDREGELLVATKYELMAEPHEQRFGVS